MNGDKETADKAKPVIATISDVKPKERDYYCEYSYRRGFTQGASAALDAIGNGVEMRKLEEWLERLMKWRAQVGKGGDYCPEQL